MSKINLEAEYINYRAFNPENRYLRKYINLRLEILYIDVFSATAIITLYSDKSAEIVHKTKSGAPILTHVYTRETRLAKMCVHTQRYTV